MTASAPANRFTGYASPAMMPAAGLTGMIDAPTNSPSRASEMVPDPYAMPYPVAAGIARTIRSAINTVAAIAAAPPASTTFRLVRH